MTLYNFYYFCVELNFMIMKRFEKIILLILALLFVLFLLPISDSFQFVFMLVLFVVAMIYCIGGYWMLNSKDDQKTALPIIAGIGFGIAILGTIFPFNLQEYDILNYFPIPNAILCLVSAVYIISKKRKGIITKNLKNIFIRSSIILILSSFLIYSPITFTPFRKLLMVLHYENKSYSDNLLMFDYRHKAEKSLAKKNYDEAINYALKSNEAGKRWNNIDEFSLDEIDETLARFKELSQFSEDIAPDFEESLKSILIANNLYYPISGTYSLLYKVYKEKAKYFFEEENYEIALENYQIANEYISLFDFPGEHWAAEKAWSYYDIAFCYNRMSEYEDAKEYYIKALEQYIDFVGREDVDFSLLISEFAFLLYKMEEWQYSVDLLLSSNKILLKESLSPEIRRKLSQNYSSLISCYLFLDYMTDALSTAELYLACAEPKSVDYYDAQLLYSTVLYRLTEYEKAKDLATQVLSSNHSHPSTNQQNGDIYFLLSKIDIALGKYNSAKENIIKRIAITKVNFGEFSVKYANDLMVLATIEKIAAHYKEAERLYDKARSIYLSHNLEYKLAELAVEKALLEIKLAHFHEAKANIDYAFDFIQTHYSFTLLPVANNLCDIAYVKYSLRDFIAADTLYRNILDTNYIPDHKRVLEASVLNGLALIAMERTNYKQADSLFTQSIHIYTDKLGDNHPTTATVKLNLAQLQLKENRLDDAEKNLNHALEVYKQHFDEDHDLIADVYSALGDLAHKRGQKGNADNYYQKAHNIYQTKFDGNHWKLEKH